MPLPAAVAAATTALSAWYLYAAISWRQAALLLVGASDGMVLYHAAFAGHIVGTRLRPMFELNVEQTQTA